jgi:hypothetical protein
MNNDLISLSALRKEIKLLKSYGNTIQQRDYGSGFIVSLSILEGKLADFPTVDAEPVRHAAWTYKDDDVCYWWECSACGSDETMNTAYCPNCGAKMDQEEK